MLKHMMAMAIVAVLAPWPAAAQAAAPTEAPGRAVADVTGGYSFFVDELLIKHHSVGGSLGWRLSPRLTVGPEVMFMDGPGGDRDLFFTGKVTFDLLRARTATPYLVGDGGLMLHRSAFRPPQFGRDPAARELVFWHREGAVSGGFGVRLRVGRAVEVAPEVRLGWEPHVRFAGVVSWGRSP